MENPFAKVIPATACNRCFDTGIWLNPMNRVEFCTRINKHHAVRNDASLILSVKVFKFGQTNFINPQAFDLARILTHYTTENPLQKKLIFDLFWAETELSESLKLRKFQGLIEQLRDDWLLPVGSRKSEPCGYWIITDLEDYKAWVDRCKSAPITQLTTIHRNARANFPVYAEQLELEFWEDFGGKNDDL